MAMISIDLPDDAVRSMHVSPSEVERELRMAAAVKLYELGRLSSGAAARLAGVPRVAFLAKLARCGDAAMERRGEDGKRPIAEACDDKRVDLGDRPTRRARLTTRPSSAITCSTF